MKMSKIRNGFKVSSKVLLLLLSTFTNLSSCSLNRLPVLEIRSLVQIALPGISIGILNLRTRVIFQAGNQAFLTPHWKAEVYVRYLTNKALI